MNFLAHALLSPPEEEILVGNLTADFIKGQARRQLPAGIQAGIALHQRIDSFTDTHPLVYRCAEMFEGKWNRYAPILVDVFFDHCLARRWEDYHARPLEHFVAQTYGAVRVHHAVLPPRAQMATTYMMTDDWLNTYVTIEGIELTLARMTRRLKHGIDLAPAAWDLAEQVAAVEEIFVGFFGELQQALVRD